MLLNIPFTHDMQRGEKGKSESFFAGARALADTRISGALCAFMCLYVHLRRTFHE
jgi:hypothetical protein